MPPPPSPLAVKKKSRHLLPHRLPSLHPLPQQLLLLMQPPALPLLLPALPLPPPALLLLLPVLLLLLPALLLP